MNKHLCPRQVRGVRIGLCAEELLRLELPRHDKLLYAFVETDGCFVDGVTVATGCSTGHRTLCLMDYGKVAVSFVDMQTGNAFRIWLNTHLGPTQCQCGLNHTCQLCLSLVHGSRLQTAIWIHPHTFPRQHLKPSF